VNRCGSLASGPEGDDVADAGERDDGTQGHEELENGEADDGRQHDAEHRRFDPHQPKLRGRRAMSIRDRMYAEPGAEPKETRNDEGEGRSWERGGRGRCLRYFVATL